jgi:basic membrane protein A
MFFGSSFWQFAPNVVSYTNYGNELGYLSGILAGGVSKTGMIGYLRGAEFPVMRAEINGYIMGAQLMNPDIKVLRSFTGDFEDLTKGMEAALALIDSGVDVINSGNDGLTLGAIQGVHSRNTAEDPRYILGFVSDQNSIAPDTVLSTGEYYFKVMLGDMITKYREGTLEGGEYFYGIKEGGIGLAPFHGLEDVVPQETKDAIDKAIEDIKAGTLEIPWITEYVIET